MIQRLVLICAAGAVAILILFAVRPREAAATCANRETQAEVVAARRELNDAARQMEEAWMGGSRYAAAKVASVDPADVERAAVRQREAAARLERAQTACTPK